MPTFTYKAKDRNGGTVDGLLDAPDTKAAAGMIREMGYWPLDIRQQGGENVQKTRSGESVFAPIWTGVSVRSLAVFFRQLSTMLEAGMSLSEALDSLGRQKGMGRLPKIALVAAEHIRDGGLFSDVLARYPRTFSSMQMGLVRAGETGGMLDSMIGRIADYLERELALRHKFSRVTFYPKLIAVFIIAAILFVSRINDIIAGGWPVVWSILWNKAVPVALGVLGAYIVLKLLLTVPPIRYVWDDIKLSFPVLGWVTRKLAMSRFSTALSVMYSAGVPISHAVELSSDSLGNEVLRRKVLQSVPRLQSGGNISDALRQTGGVPEFVLGMISTGERTGSMDQVLDKVSEYYDSEAETTIEKSGYLLFVLLIVAAGVVVAYIVLNFYMGYAQGLGL